MALVGRHDVGRAPNARGHRFRRVVVSAAGLLVLGVIGTSLGALSTTISIGAAGAAPAATPVQGTPPPLPQTPANPTGLQPNVSGGSTPALAAQPPQLASPYLTYVVDTISDTTPSTNAAVAESACATANTNSCSLRAAIEAADFVAEGTPGTNEVIAIDVPGGTYTLSNGPLEITDANGIIITGGTGGTGPTVIEQSADTTERVIDVAACGQLQTTDPLYCSSNSLPANVSISDLTVTGGNVTDDTTIDEGGSSGTGGGIYIAFDDLLQMNGVTVTANSAVVDTDGGWGGGIAGIDGQLWMADSTVTANTAGADGGGIYLYDTPANLTDDTIADNTAGSDVDESLGGGGIFVEYGSTVNITGGAITANTAESADMPEGGGLWIDSATTITDVNISGNTAETEAEVGAPQSSTSQGTNGHWHDPAYGGGIYDNAGLTAVNGATISDNTAVDGNDDGGAYGGGILIIEGSPTISASTISGNKAEATGTDSYDAAGGGVAVGAEDDEEEVVGSVSLVYDEVTDNTASSSDDYGQGGGVYFLDGSLVVDVSTISANTATSGSSSSESDYPGGGGGIFGEGYVEEGGPVQPATVPNQEDEGAGTLTTADSQISDNTATNGYGGGVFEDFLNSSYYRGDVIVGNQATEGIDDDTGDGGGILSVTYASTINGSTIAYNGASQYGGGIAADDDSGMQLQDSTVERNAAIWGAGIDVDGTTFQATSSAVVDNTSGGPATSDPAGGGIYDDGYIDFYAITIAGNVSPSGAGIYADNDDSPGQIGTSTIADNVTTTGGTTEQDCAFATGTGPFVSAGGNVTEDDTCSLDGTSDRVGLAHQGYWLAGSDGGAFAINTTFYGSLPGLGISVNNIVGIAKTPGNEGYWLVGRDGGVFSFGSARYDGGLPGMGITVNNIVGIVATPDGGGYWLVGRDGGVFSFGDAGFFGSMGGLPLDAPIVGITATPDGRGYWLVASDGGVFAFGDAGFLGSMGGHKLGGPIVGMTPTTDGNGYWLVGRDGGVFSFGDAPFEKSLPVLGVSTTIIKTIMGTPEMGGYWLADQAGNEYPFGDAPSETTLAALGKIVDDIVGGADTTEA